MSEYFVSRPGLNGTRKTFKEYEKNETRERKRALLHLISGYLRDCNLQETADVLTNEAQLANHYELCDNVDLDIILQDYQTYYYAKFGKAAKILRKVETEGGGDGAGKSARRRTKVQSPPSTQSTQSKPPKETSNVSTAAADNFQIEVTHLASKKSIQDPELVEKDEVGVVSRPPLCDFPGYTTEWREMAELIVREIAEKNGDGVTWRDCIGVEGSVELLKEAAVYPLVHPELFKGLLTPWKGILLYGPPGTGKTLLAKALINESPSTFINLTLSTFVSKWRGDSEKMLKVLFDVARYYAPSTIFVDELDAVASKYEDHQHDASRRFKSELLIQMDGVLSRNDNVFVLATTNLPWNLNSAILRRFEKRILVNVPGPTERSDLFKYYLKDRGDELSENDYVLMAENSENFSGADIRTVCKEALMGPLRETLSEIKSSGRKSLQPSKIRALTMDDVWSALEKSKSTTTPEDVAKYLTWSKLHANC